MTEVTIEQPAASEPVAEAVAAVEVLAAAEEAGRQDGMALGALIARIDAMQTDNASMRSEIGELRATLLASAELTNGLTAAVADLNARLEQEQAAHADAIEDIVEAVEEPTEPVVEVVPEPVVDNTPSRKRHWA